MNPAIKLVKGHYGWTAESTVPLGPEFGPGRALKITTMKRSARIGVAAIGTVVKLAEDGHGYSFVMCQDYSAVMAADTGNATEKRVLAVHALALSERVEATVAAARAHYGIKLAA